MYTRANLNKRKIIFFFFFTSTKITIHQFHGSIVFKRIKIKICTIFIKFILYYYIMALNVILFLNDFSRTSFIYRHIYILFYIKPYVYFTFFFSNNSLNKIWNGSRFVFQCVTTTVVVLIKHNSKGQRYFWNDFSTFY